jgi:hypothetical protein
MNATPNHFVTETYTVDYIGKDGTVWTRLHIYGKGECDGRGFRPDHWQMVRQLQDEALRASQEFMKQEGRVYEHEKAYRILFVDHASDGMLNQRSKWLALARVAYKNASARLNTALTMLSETLA